MELNKIYNTNCIDFMKSMQNNSVDLTLTDIPYGGVSREDNGLNNLDKGNANLVTFSLEDFLPEIFRVTKSTIIIFCGVEQISTIFDFFEQKQKEKKGTPRQLVWKKTNPSPMNGQYVYLSGIENAIWFKKRGGTFNAHCKNTVFDHPIGTSRMHPTEKNHKLLRELILDNSNENQIVFDPCAGSGSHLLVARDLKRQFIGCEIDKEYCNKMAELRGFKVVGI